MTESQERAFRDHWPSFGIDIQAGVTLDPVERFGNLRPTFLEIGFGNGEGLAETAAAHPEHNYIGVEVHGPGVGHLLILAAEKGLTNLRLIKHDAVEVLRDHLPPFCLDGIQLFFPDPWHKTRHRKRRIVQPAFVDFCLRVLKPGGIIHMATDWKPYAQQMLQVLGACEQLTNQAGPGTFAPRPETRPLTKFEQRGQRLGHGVWDLLFVRC
jgi:tRNA (guanine-N7-)-methyltransferase